MDHLVFLDANSDELGKILRGLKRMVVREIASPQRQLTQVRPGDRLYFLRNNGEGIVRLKASVSNTYPFEAETDEDMSLRLKELQVILQLTEPQYEYWAAKKQALFVEFEQVGKTLLSLTEPNKSMTQTEWISLEDISVITD